MNNVLISPIAEIFGAFYHLFSAYLGSNLIDLKTTTPLYYETREKLITTISKWIKVAPPRDYNMNRVNMNRVFTCE